MLILSKGGQLLPVIVGCSRFLLQPAAVTSCAVRNYAARKGTRERKKKQKVKVEVEKVGFIPHRLRDKEKHLLNRPKKKYDDSMKGFPQDNVFLHKNYKYMVYSFEDAIKCHRETHHADMYNQPNANLNVSIELNMQGEKKTRFVDNFTRIAPIPHVFDHGEERTVLVFSKIPEMQEQAKAAGAQLVGGVELIKQIQNGVLSLQDFQFIVADPGILPELVALRGLMKRKFPSPKNGTLDNDLGSVVAKFMNGIRYSAVQDEYEKDFGLIETSLGTLNMETRQLEENFISLVKDIYKVKPKRQGTFIDRCLLWSPPSRERLKVDHVQYISDEKPTQDNKVEAEEVEEVVAAIN